MRSNGYLTPNTEYDGYLTPNTEYDGYLTPNTEYDGYLTPSNSYSAPLFLSDNSTENDNYDVNHKKGPHKVDICVYIYVYIIIFSYHISYIWICIYLYRQYILYDIWKSMYLYLRCICIYHVFMYDCRLRMLVYVASILPYDCTYYVMTRTLVREHGRIVL
jgi:hypothetical protein